MSGKNKLIKNTTTHFSPGDPGVPADPGSPYLPERTVTEYREVCGYGPDYNAMLAMGWTRHWDPGDGGYGGQWIWVPPGINSGTTIPYSYQCNTEPYQVTYPAQPAVPPTPGRPPVPSEFYTDNNLGWNSGASSIKPLNNDGRYEFQASPSSAGIVIGLNGPEKEGYGYQDIKHAFYLTHGSVRIMEKGAEILNIGPFAEEDVFSIVRDQGTVTYLINGEEVYASEEESSGVVTLDVSMYSGEDMVFNPSVTAESSAHLSFMPLSGQENLLSFRPMQFPKSVGAMSFRPLSGQESLMSFMPLELDSNKEAVPQYGIGAMSFSPLTGAGFGYKAKKGEGDMSFQPLIGAGGNYRYGSGDMSFPPMWMTAGQNSGPAEDSGPYISHTRRGAFASVVASTLINAISGRSPRPFVEQKSRLIVRVVSGRSLGSSASMTTHTLLRLFSGRSPSPIVQINDPAHEAWVMNADAGGFTRYENYPFNSFVQLEDGTCLGASVDGIYELDGDDDNGEPIRAMVSFGVQDFGTTALKRVSNAYAGVSCDGRLWLRAIVEGEAYTYLARDGGLEMKTQRFDIGRGIRANYLEFELYNEQGEDFELSSVEFVALPLSRRI